jgi:pilus assembly protein Flp/PilA
MRHLLQRLGHDQSGATSIEYGLIASLIFVVIVGSIAALGNSNTGLYARIKDTVIPALDKALGTGGEDSGGGEDGED